MLSIKNAMENDAGRYRCHASSSGIEPTATRYAVLNVQCKLAFNMVVHSKAHFLFYKTFYSWNSWIITGA